MDWEQAKTHELFVIAYDDPYAEPLDVFHAKTEIKRRKEKRKYAKLQQKEVKHYPK